MNVDPDADLVTIYQGCTHHHDPLGVYQPCRVGMMREYIASELLTWDTFLHHDDQGHSTVKYYAALEGFRPGGGGLDIVLE